MTLIGIAHLGNLLQTQRFNGEANFIADISIYINKLVKNNQLIRDEPEIRGSSKAPTTLRSIKGGYSLNGINEVGFPYYFSFKVEGRIEAFLGYEGLFKRDPPFIKIPCLPYLRKKKLGSTRRILEIIEPLKIEYSSF